MTGLELATQFRNLVDDDFDTTHLYQLLSQAKNQVERIYKLEICKVLDSSKTSAIGDTYTNPKALPTDFRTLLKISLDRIPYLPARFEDQVRYRNVARRVVLDIKNNQFFPTGPVAVAGTWNIFYIYKTEDFNVANEDDEVCVWPDEFQPLIPYQAAKIYQANIDGDAISFRMSQEQEKEYQRLLDALINWDADLKLSAMNGRTGFDDSELDDQDFDVGLL